jgi:hypothetical protein
LGAYSINAKASGPNEIYRENVGRSSEGANMTLQKRAEMGMGLLIDNRDEPLIDRVRDIIKGIIEDCAEIAHEELDVERGFAESRSGEDVAEYIEARIRALLDS